MKCEKAQELYSDHLEGLLERPMAVAFDQHIAECKSCAHEYESFKTTWQMLETLPEVAPPPGFAWDVVMKVRMQLEAERRKTPKWKQVWDSLFISRIPAKAYAGAAAVAVLALTIFQTPLRYSIGAYLLGKPNVAEITAPKPAITETKQIGEAWRHSGLKFDLGVAGIKDGTGIFQLVLKPQGAVKQHVRVSVLDLNRAVFGQLGLERSGPDLFNGTVDQTGQVVSSVWRTGEQADVMGMLVEWNHQGRRFAEVIFVPTRFSPTSEQIRRNMDLKSTNIYVALKNISSTFGVVILVNGDITSNAGDIAVNNGTVDDAFYQALSDIGLSWRNRGPQVWSVDRKIE